MGLVRFSEWTLFPQTELTSSSLHSGRWLTMKQELFVIMHVTYFPCYVNPFLEFWYILEWAVLQTFRSNIPAPCIVLKSLRRTKASKDYMLRRVQVRSTAATRPGRDMSSSWFWYKRYSSAWFAPYGFFRFPRISCHLLVYWPLCNRKKAVLFASL